MADIFNMLDTWNASGATFTGIKLNVTDTASAAGSLLMDLQVGGTSRFKVDKSGVVTLGGSAGFAKQVASDYLEATTGWSVSAGANTGCTMQSGGFVAGPNASFAFGNANGAGTRDLILTRDAANTLAQRNGVNAQAFNLYQSYTDASNYTRGRVAAASGIVTIAGESAGTGATDIDIALTPKGTGRVRYGTHAAIAAETVTGYIEIKDAGGTVRKIAVVS